MPAADRIERDKPRPAREQEGKEKFARPLPELQLFKQPAREEDEIVRPHAEQRGKKCRAKNVGVKDGREVGKDEGGKVGADGQSQRHGEQHAHEHRDDDRRHRAEKDLGREALLSLLEGECHARERSVEGDGEPRARAARDLIAPYERVAPQKIARAVSERPADEDARTLAARGQPHKDGEQADREHARQLAVPMKAHKSAHRALRLRDAAAADEGQKADDPAHDDRPERERQK